MNTTRLRQLSLCILFLWIRLLACPPARAQGDPASEIIQRVNALRAAYGLPAYQVDSSLMVAAQAQASWSAENNHVGHDGPGGSSPIDRARAAGYGGNFKSFAIENVAQGTASLNTPELVVTMWQGDWGHLTAMISEKYEHIGVGYAEANDFSYYVMMVGWIDDGSTPENPSTAAAPVENAPHAPLIVNTPDESGAIYHEVQSGQSAWTIAAWYGVTLAELLALNHLTEASILHPGDVLLIRAAVLKTSTPSVQNTPEATLAATIPPAKSPPAMTDIPLNTPTRSSHSATASPTQPLESSRAPSTRSLLIPILVAILGLAGLIGIVMSRSLRKR